MRNNYTFVILADKPMPNCKKLGQISNIQYKGETILDNQIREIRRFDKYADIILVTGFDRGSIQRNDIRIIENSSYNKTGDAESIRVGINASAGSSIFILCGLSIPCKLDLIQLAKNNSILLSLEPGKNIGVFRDGHRLLSFSYRPKNNWMNTVFFKGENSIKLKEEINRINSNYTMYEVITKIMKNVFIVDNTDSVMIETVGDLV